MFLPIGDTPNPRGFTPWVTWLLIAVNVAIYLLWTLPLSLAPPDPSDPAWQAVLDRIAGLLPPGVPLESVLDQLSAWDLAVQEHGYKPGAPSGSDLLASMFLHAGLAHLAGNMLFLWIYGDNVEHRLGRAPFLAAYLGSGAAATLAFAAFATDPDTPLVGASGAISGVLGLYFLLFPRNRVKVWVVLFPFFFDVWLVPAPLVLGLYVIVDNLLPYLVGVGGSVAYGAHLGGFLAGLGLAAVVSRMWPGASDDGPDLRALAAELRQTADPGRRARLHVELGRGLADLGQTSSAFQHAAQALQLAPDPGTAAAARALLAELPIDPRLRARYLGS